MKGFILGIVCVFIVLLCWWTDDKFTEYCDFANRSDNEAIWWLPTGSTPNDFNFFAEDCNIPVRVIDANGTLFLMKPMPMRKEPFLSYLLN